MHDHSTKNQGLHWFIFLFVHDHSTKLYVRLSLIYFSFLHDHSTKNQVLVNLFIYFICTRPFKVRCHSYFLIYSFLNCTNISFAILTADTAFIFRTPYSWKSCCYISYAISMAIWNLRLICSNSPVLSKGFCFERTAPVLLVLSEISNFSSRSHVLQSRYWKSLLLITKLGAYIAFVHCLYRQLQDPCLQKHLLFWH